MTSARAFSAVTRLTATAATGVLVRAPATMPVRTSSAATSAAFSASGLIVLEHLDRLLALAHVVDVGGVGVGAGDEDRLRASLAGLHRLHRAARHAAVVGEDGGDVAARVLAMASSTVLSACSGDHASWLFSTTILTSPLSM